MKKMMIALIFVFMSLAAYAGNNDDCYKIDNISDREACMGNAYATNNSNARNIILGHCYALDDEANSSGLRDICLRGRDGCYALKDSSEIQECLNCNGSRKWARLYAVGYIMTCY